MMEFALILFFTLSLSHIHLLHATSLCRRREREQCLAIHAQKKYFKYTFGLILYIVVFFMKLELFQVSGLLLSYHRNGHGGENVVKKINHIKAFIATARAQHTGSHGSWHFIVVILLFGQSKTFFN